ncbi:MAG: flavodoxin family protein [Candidatus Bathyarchaeia archaeon]
MKKALIIYHSSTGNTQKVAEAIKEGLQAAGVNVEIKKPKEASDLDFYSYDLVCVGSPSIQWQPAKPITDLMTAKMNQYRDAGKIKPSAPKVPGKNAMIFVTYSGPHTGANEATPVGKVLGQYFEHWGFTVLEEMYVLCEFIGRLDLSTQGRMGDIRGKPTVEELAKVKSDAQKLAQRL